MKTFKLIVKWIICKIFFRVEFKGKENIDSKKSYVFMANHVTSFDAPFIWSDNLNLAMMAKEEIFKFKPLGAIFKAVGAFPIARGKKDFSHVLHAVKVVSGEHPKSLLIFPEGTRRAKEKNIKAKNGAVYIAAAAGVQVVPIHVTEKFRLFGKVVVEYKKPVDLRINKENIKDKKLLTEETERIMKIIYEGDYDAK